jgi:type II secretory pathway pseudopilin PulG
VDLKAIVMVSKTPKNQPKGFTVLEILITITVVMIVLGASIVLFNPAIRFAKARDEKRLSDISLLERVINEYRIDNGFYPDEADALRVSTSLPPDNIGPLQSTTSGWIKEDLSEYNAKLPTDPTNDATYFYSYQHNGYAYEINANFEQLIEFAQNDGGDDPAVYEVGDDLTII